MTEPRVEAGDRALETARKVVNFRDPGHGGNFICFCAECEDSRAALIQSAMNAQEREWREALQNLVSQLQKCHADQRYQSVWQLYAIHGGQYTGPFYREQLAEAERLLAERGEGKMSTGEQFLEEPEDFGLVVEPDEDIEPWFREGFPPILRES